jgi:hypothetical protein
MESAYSVNGEELVTLLSNFLTVESRGANFDLQGF